MWIGIRLIVLGPGICRRAPIQRVAAGVPKRLVHRARARQACSRAGVIYVAIQFHHVGLWSSAPGRVELQRRGAVEPDISRVERFILTASILVRSRVSAIFLQ